MCPGEGLGCSVWCGGPGVTGGALGRMVSMAGMRPPALRSGWAGGGQELGGGDVPGGPGTRLGRCPSVWATDLARAEPVHAAASVGCPSVLGVALPSPAPGPSARPRICRPRSWGGVVSLPSSLPGPRALGLSLGGGCCPACAPLPMLTKLFQGLGC